ncbi:MAG TPA: ACT domain-containing protein [Opitutaceae bacterium]|nr:ACT domain-containing protein [Opitutaceae bacterium]
MKLQLRRQITIALKNEPGQLAKACDALARKGVNIDAISILDTIEQGVIRLLTSDYATAREILTAQGCHVVEAEVLEIEAKNHPGTLAKLARSLADAGINIEYAYGTEGSSSELMRICLRVSDPAKALNVLGG